MTDTIGWGDVDVEDRPRRRRKTPAAWVWLAVGVMVAAVALWPTVQNTLADRAARWLQRQWLTSEAYDTARTTAEQRALTRLAAGDGASMVRIVSALDREQASKLTRLADEVGRHHSWAANVRAAARLVRRTMLAEAHDLRADGSVAASQFEGLGYPNPMSAPTDELRFRTEAQLAHLFRARHLSGRPLVTADLTSADPLVAQLGRVTSAPLRLRLALMHGGQLDVWDLQSRAVRRNVVGDLPDDAPTGVLPVVGASLLAQFDTNWQLWPITGPRPRSLPPASPNGFYQPTGDGGLWRTDERRIRRYDTAGQPVGAWYSYPAGANPSPYAATPDALVIVLGPVDFNDPHPALWYPRTGRVAPLQDDPCFGSFVSGGTTIGYLSCDQRQLTLVDTRSGRTRKLRVPYGLRASGAGPVISPDGTTLALPAVSQSTEDDAPTTLLVVDLRSGGVTQLHTRAAPLAWAPDSSTLLLDVNGYDPSSAADSTFAPLAYWKPGMTDLAGIRINLVDGQFGVALLR